VTVIATDENDQLANYSNYGLHNTDIAAPGSKILSTILNGQVWLMSSLHVME
jgi:subtilisin family serine protease